MTSEVTTVFGAGSWGTALAKHVGDLGRNVVLWTRNPERAEQIERTRVNETYLPGHTLPATVVVTADIAQAVQSKYVILSLPSEHLRRFWIRVSPDLRKDAYILNTAKGFDRREGTTLSDMLATFVDRYAFDRISVLSGPNHAQEVAANLPSATVVASTKEHVAAIWQKLLMGPMFRVYTTDDVKGAELGGALKNVIALATGMSDGLGFGDNTKAAIITRGLAEIVRLGMAMGADPVTFSGLSGIGDLVATCTSHQSRNTRAGREIGRGTDPDTVLEEAKPMVIEGMPTSRTALGLSQKWDVEMPITQVVSAVLARKVSPSDAVHSLMERHPKSEDPSF